MRRTGPRPDADVARDVMAAFDEVPAELVMGESCRWLLIPIEDFGESGRPEWLHCQNEVHAGSGRVVGGWVSMLANTDTFTFAVWGICDECRSKMAAA